MASAAAGLAAVMRANPLLFGRCSGSRRLPVLAGAQLLRRRLDPAARRRNAALARDVLSPGLRGEPDNPKVILFFVSFFALF